MGTNGCVRGIVAAALLVIACGPSTSGGSASGSAGESADTSSTSSSTATTSSGESSSSSTSSGSTSSTTMADESTSGGEHSCTPPGTDCPPGECCVQDVPGIFLCAPFGGLCNCQTDRDCSDGKHCLPWSIKGEQACLECVQDHDCPEGFMCSGFDEYLCVPIEGSSSSSGSSGGSSSDSTGA